MAVSFVAVGSSYAAENAITDISVMSNIQSQSWVGEELTDGDFYLYNVGSQNYMTAGNNWGTRASLGPDGYTLSLITTGTTTTISTNKYYSNKFLGSDGFVDAGSYGWTFTNIGEGDNYIYTIGNGTNLIGFEGGESTTVSLTLNDATSDNAKWLIISKEQLIKNLSLASAENPINATPFIINANFGRATRKDMWSGTQPGIGGNGNDPYRASWVGEIYQESKAKYDMYQIIEGVPNGKYILEAKGFIRDGSIGESTDRRINETEILDTYLYINGEKTPLKSIYDQDEALDFGTSTSLGNIPNSMDEASRYMYYGNYSGIVVEAIVTDNNLKLGIMSNGNYSTSCWALFDDFKLTYCGKVDLSEAKIPLEKAIAEAKELYNSENDGSEAFDAAIKNAENAYQNATSIEELSVAIQELAEAKKLYIVYSTNDASGLFANLSFESGLTGWDNSGFKTASSNAIDPYKEGSTFAEQWSNHNQNATLSDISIYQTVIVPNGYYKISVSGHAKWQSDETIEIIGAYLVGNDQKLSLGQQTGEYIVETEVTAGELKIGIETSNTNANWVAFDNFKVKYYESVSKMYQIEYLPALNEAKAALDNEDYSVVIGNERMALASEVAKDEPTDAEGYKTAINNLKTTKDAFIASLSQYNILAYALNQVKVDLAKEYPYASDASKAAVEEYKDFDVTSISDKEAALEKGNTILSSVRKYVESNALAEGVNDATILTSTIIDANAESKDGWNGALSILSNEPFTDGDGNSNYSYFDKWDGNAWNADMNQEISLDKGIYMLTVTARGSNANQFVVYANDKEADIPLIGANVNSGTFGRGYNDTFVVFTVKEKGISSIGIKADMPGGQWLSASRFRLVRLGNYIPTSIEDIEVVAPSTQVDIYSIDGILVKKGAESLEGLDKGIYIVGGKKVMIK